MKICITYLLLTSLFLFLSEKNAYCKDYIICPDCENKSIKETLLRASDGDKLIVKKGYYRENNIVIDKAVSIFGEDKPVIDLEFANQGFVIKSKGVTLNGLEIRNISASYVQDLSAIKIENTSDCIIENIFLSNTFFGIYLANSFHCTVKNNLIKGEAKTESSSGNGIHLWKCSNITIENNESTGHRDGIYFEFVKNSFILNNYSHNNLRYGLHFMFSDSNSYRKNLFRENGAGVAVMYTKHIEMTENKFEDNWGPASYGILLKEISFSTVSKNTFYKNTTGIYMEGSDNMRIINNDFINNGWAVKVLGNCTGNNLMGNNFEGNTFDISSNSSRNENQYEGNYWDKYKGYDLNNDDIGDVPYRPVSLYSILVEKIPESIILLRSFITDVLDVTEKVLPVFIPETLIDDKPGMTRFNHD